MAIKKKAIMITDHTDMKSGMATYAFIQKSLWSDKVSAILKLIWNYLMIHCYRVVDTAF